MNHTDFKTDYFSLTSLEKLDNFSEEIKSIGAEVGAPPLALQVILSNVEAAQKDEVNEGVKVATARFENAIEFATELPFSAVVVPVVVTEPAIAIVRGAVKVAICKLRKLTGPIIV